MPIDPRTPVVVGVGQHTEHDLPARFHDGVASSPEDLAARAAEKALRDSSAGQRVAAAIDTVVSIRTFADSSPQRVHPFGRSSAPPRSVAQRIGAKPERAIYSQAGGNAPQQWVNRCAAEIAAGDSDCVLLSGAEPLRTIKAATAAGLDLDWSDEPEGDLDDRGFGEIWINACEIAHKVIYPIHVYPLFEQGIRGLRGATVEEHLVSMARLFAPMSQVAADNPYAMKRVARSQDELANPTGENRFVVHPYPRLLNARDTVDQSAALLLMSVEKAESLGVPKDRWVFLHGCADSLERFYVLDRVNYWSAPAIGVLAETAFGMAGLNVDDVQFFDLYSCFPSAVELAVAELGMAENDRRGFTLTGGLPFFGGPGNNYSMHGIAEAVDRCRENDGAFAMVTANGGSLTKHSAGIYGSAPFSGTWQRPDPAPGQAKIAALQSPSLVDEHTGPCVVETASVILSKGGTPEWGIVIARTLSGARFPATCTDESSLNRLTGDELVGLQGESRCVDGKNSFLL